MGKVIKGLLATGAGAGLFIAGNLAPNFIEEKPSVERTQEDVAELAKNCGSTALTDALGGELDASLSPTEAQTIVQAQVDQQMAKCIEDNITEPIVAAVDEVESPQIGIEWQLTEGKG